jgi:hypothetical protein
MVCVDSQLQMSFSSVIVAKLGHTVYGQFRVPSESETLMILRTLILPFACNVFLSKEILDAIFQHWEAALSPYIKAVGMMELKLLSGQNQLAPLASNGRC